MLAINEGNAGKGSDVEHHAEGDGKKIDFEICRFRGAVGNIYLVGSRTCMVIVEAEHTDIDFNCRIIVEEHNYARCKTHIEFKTFLEGTGYIVVASVDKF